MKPIKRDCFAWNTEKYRCNVLTEILCKEGECSFYKTEEQFNADLEKYPYNKDYGKEKKYEA